VEEEVGVIHAVEPVEIEPVVAYVPDAEQTQTIFVPSSGMKTAPPDEVEAVEAVPSVTGSAPTGSEVAPAEAAVESASETVAEAVPVTMEEAAPVVAAVTESPASEEPAPAEEHTSVVHAVEAALAAAAGTAVAGIAHAVQSAPAETPAEVHEPAPMIVETAPQHETFGDAALAEELAAALSHKEPEGHPHTEPATSVTEPVSGASLQGLSDVKLADAVARAFENLKPQLITEIIKELSK
jgi:hypothetical protein